MEGRRIFETATGGRAPKFFLCFLAVFVRGACGFSSSVWCPSQVLPLKFVSLCLWSLHSAITLVDHGGLILEDAEAQARVGLNFMHLRSGVLVLVKSPILPLARPYTDTSSATYVAGSTLPRSAKHKAGCFSA